MMECLAGWRYRRATGRWTGKHPLLDAILDNAQKVLDDDLDGLGLYLDDSQKAGMLEALAKESHGILFGPNPLQTARLKLGSWICTTASLEVLVLDEMTGWQYLHSIPGITGELKFYVEAIAKVNEKLGNLLTEKMGIMKKATVFEVLTVCYWESRLYMHACNVLRLGLGESAATKTTDWFKPFFISMCIFYEFRYRSDVKLPSKLPQSDPFIPVVHSLWINLLREGEKDLRQAWDRQWELRFNLGVSPYAGLEF